jgi:hypothetical protein
MIESKKWSERLKLAMFSGFGYLLGSLLVILFLELNK